MTGRRAAGSGSGVQTLTVSQSSPPGASAGPAVPAAPRSCGGGGPKAYASRTPSQGRARRGAANRASPTGGWANGMPRKTDRPSSLRPRTAPPEVRTTGSTDSTGPGIVILRTLRRGAHGAQLRVFSDSASYGASSPKRPERTFSAHRGSWSSARPTATRSNSSRSRRSRRLSRPWTGAPSPWKALSKSPSRPTEPTVMVVLPVSFLVQPARLRSEPSNSGSQ